MDEVQSIKSAKEILRDIEQRYSILSDLVRAVADGAINGLLVRGEAGIGKSHVTLEILDGYNKTRNIKILTGHVTPLQLYTLMFENSTPESIIVFDDCDDAFSDIGCLNVLKAATDTKKHRIVNWLSSSRLVPAASFLFQGRIVVVTNADLRTSVHYRAFLDRIFHYDMSLTIPERIVKISDLAQKIEGIDRRTANRVVAWIKENSEELGTRLTLRTFVKTAALAKYSRRWKELAKATAFSEL